MKFIPTALTTILLGTSIPVNSVLATPTAPTNSKSSIIQNDKEIIKSQIGNKMFQSGKQSEPVDSKQPKKVWTEAEILAQTAIFDVGWNNPTNLVKGQYWQGRNLRWYLDKDYTLHLGNGEWTKSDQITGDSSLLGELASQVKVISNDVAVDGVDFDMAFSASSVLGYKMVVDEIRGLDKLDTSKAKYMFHMFNGQKSIVDLDISSFDTKNVVDFSHMFDGMESLKYLDLTNMNTEQAVNMEGMFYQCFSINGLDFKSFKTSQVVNMSSLFYRCRALSNLDLSSFDTSNVARFDYMFFDAESLTSLDLSHFNTSKATTMSSMFATTINLKNLDISNFNTSNVITMSSMFSAVVLESLDLSHFNTANVVDMNYMFANAKLLKKVDISNFDTSKVRSFDSFLSMTESLKDFPTAKINSDSATNFSNMFRTTALDVIDVAHFNTAKATNMREMFIGTHAPLDVSNFNTSNVLNFYSMFQGSKSKVLDVSNFDTSKATNMGGMFQKIQAEHLDVSNFSTLNVNDMSGMFYDVNAPIDISSFDTTNVNKFGLMLHGVKRIKFGTGFNFNSKIAEKYTPLAEENWYNISNPDYTSTGLDFENVYNPNTMSGWWTWDIPLSLTSENIDFGDITLGQNYNKTHSLTYYTPEYNANITARLENDHDLLLTANNQELDTNDSHIAKLNQDINTLKLDVDMKIKAGKDTAIGAKENNIIWTISTDGDKILE